MQTPTVKHQLYHLTPVSQNNTIQILIMSQQTFCQNIPGIYTCPVRYMCLCNVTRLATTYYPYRQSTRSVDNLLRAIVAHAAKNFSSALLLPLHRVFMVVYCNIL